MPEPSAQGAEDRPPVLGALLEAELLDELLEELPVDVLADPDVAGAAFFTTGGLGIFSAR